MNLLEKEKKLSESLLWKLQYNAYTQFGPKAWSQMGVPFYVTSNPYTAYCYAQVVFGYLQDNPLHINAPIYLFDLGAGTGRFAYLFLKEFMALIESSPLKGLSFHYILTDIVQENFSFWLQHPLLKDYFEQGILDYCFYHHEITTESLYLEISKKIITNNEKNPIILIANYFFDTIPQDLFRINDGVLEEGFITLYTTKEFANYEDPEIINDLSWEYTFIPVDNPENIYVENPSYRELLLSYQKDLKNGTFLFPVGALQSLDFFKKLSDGNWLLLAGDQGVTTLEQIQAWEPKLALHGSFSIAVSYHTLANYFASNFGLAFLSEMPDPAFVIIAGILTEDKRSFFATEYAFKNFMNAFEPQDYWRFGMELEKADVSLEAILLLIKLGRFDPMNMHGFYSKIRKELPFTSEAIQKRLSYTIEKVEQNFFPIAPEDGDFIANLGVLYYDLKEFKKAHGMFLKAKAYVGGKPYLLNNITACEAKLNK